MFLFRKKAKVSQIERPIETPDIEIPVEQPQVDQPEQPEAVVPRKRRRANANRTKLIGLDASDGRVVDLFDEEKAPNEGVRFQFPVALLMVVSGPGRGECFALKSGMSQIGRGEDQAVCLDFGDMAISRSNHAAVVYDPKENEFLLGHGGKSNIVRLNGKPVVSTSPMATGDEIEIGETRLRFVALCTGGFNWETTEDEQKGSDDDDMEIA